MATPAKKKRFILRRPRTAEISYVPAGAVDRTFCLRKNEGEPMKPEILQACLNASLDDEDKLAEMLAKAETDPKAAEAITAALRLLAAFKDLLKPADLELIQSILNEQPLPDEGPGGAAEMQDKASEPKPAQESQAPTQKSANNEGPPAMSQETQAKFEQIAKAHAEAEERISKLQKALADKEEADALRTCIAKAQEQFPHLGPAKDVGKLLRKLESAGLDKDVEEMLRGANARAQSASLFDEYGLGSHLTKSDDDSAAAKLHRRAQEISKSQNVPLAKAHVMACEENPKLYEESDKAKRGR
jgi:hypothetical protein